jgi:hypothetical protein
VRSQKLKAYDKRQSKIDSIWGRLHDVLILQERLSVPERWRHYFNYTGFLRYLREFGVILVLGVSVEDYTSGNRC